MARGPGGEEAALDVVQERHHHGCRGRLASMEVGDDPQVGEAVEILQRGLVLGLQLDLARSVLGGDRLERHALQMRVRRPDDADHFIGNRCGVIAGQRSSLAFD
jgi:hypothetical protein